MSSLSRGLGLAQRALVYTPRPQCSCAAQSQRLLLRASPFFSSVRTLQTSSIRQAAAKAAPARRAPPTTRRPPPVLPATPSVAAAGAKLPPPRSFAEQLARKGSPTTLYEAPSHFWFRFSSFAAGAFCVTYTLINYWSMYIYPPEGLSWWVPHAFGVICTFMGAMGAYFVLGTSRVVRSVRAVPAAQALASHKALAKKAGAATPPLYIELAVARMVPFMRPKTIVAAPDQVELPFRMADCRLDGARGRGGAAAAAEEPVLTGRQQIEAKRAEEERRKAERKYEMDHLMTAPFRHAGQAMVTMWDGIRKSLTREGLAKVYVEGRMYKMDLSGGWALDQGRALDRLVNVKR
ncbi:uncharacterized protein E0L32_008992 [Thyridium curvatum]|uniref:Uncharacterized protein n=1 Tax=Thyridium curvatum TaxID=1093900 RepID=A0A507AXZ4_9PEZI|nr:uncharacterized protein E0L32_008992 [Thyridium curvatum]TPX09801.1 hypothetical protein E0L32_008992 [Thyridium curvatum]